MAGSYRHVTDSRGRYIGSSLIENLGDASEAIEEMHAMIEWLGNRVAGLDRSLDTPQAAIHAAWREGYLRPLRNGNADIEDISGYAAFWEDDE